jgi:hypothetical protein
MDAIRIAALVVTLAFPGHGHGLLAHGAAAQRPAVVAYAGNGAWIDRYDFNRIDDPAGVVRDIQLHGVRTLYVETGSWRVPRADIVAPDATAQLVEAAHAAGIQVVAWYLPGFADPRRDMRRIRAALSFTTPSGQRFDSFALDIEANILNPVRKRNIALLRMSRAIRRTAGDGYALGAIVPDRLSTSSGNVLWPSLPYAQLARTYDVFLPMAYSTFNRSTSARGVYAYTVDNIRFLRAVTHRPVHLIGGLTADMDESTQYAVARAARDAGAYGVSLYKYMDYDEASWEAMASFSP